jgi:hypothetical protein
VVRPTRAASEVAHATIARMRTGTAKSHWNAAGNSVALQGGLSSVYMIYLVFKLLVSSCADSAGASSDSEPNPSATSRKRKKIHTPSSPSSTPPRDDIDEDSESGRPVEEVEGQQPEGSDEHEMSRPNKKIQRTQIHKSSNSTFASPKVRVPRSSTSTSSHPSRHVGDSAGHEALVSSSAVTQMQSS